MKKTICIILILLMFLFVTSCNKNNIIQTDNIQEDNVKNDEGYAFWPYKTWANHNNYTSNHYSDIKLFSPNDYFVGLYEIDLAHTFVIPQGFLDKNSNSVYDNTKPQIAPSYYIKLDKTNSNQYYLTRYSNIFSDENVKSFFLKNSSISIEQTIFAYDMSVYNTTNISIPNNIDYEIKTNQTVHLIATGNISEWILEESLTIHDSSLVYNDIFCYTKVLTSTQTSNQITKSFVNFYSPYLQYTNDHTDIETYRLYITNVEAIQEIVGERTYVYYIQETSQFSWEAKEHFYNAFDNNLKERFNVLIPFLENNQTDTINHFLSI